MTTNEKLREVVLQHVGWWLDNIEHSPDPELTLVINRDDAGIFNLDTAYAGMSIFCEANEVSVVAVTGAQEVISGVEPTRIPLTAAQRHFISGTPIEQE